MPLVSIIPITGFSDPVSSWTHLLAAVMALIGLFYLVHKGRGNSARTTSLIIFSFSLIFLFSMSGVYHLLSHGFVSRNVFQRLDHAAIWTLIAGTFTPIHIILFRGFWRWGVLLLIWTVAITGLVLTTVFFNSVPETLTIIFYIGLGWLGMLTYWQLTKNIGEPNRKYLLYGGISYSFGALIEFLRWPVVARGVIESHEIFHLFVILGAAFHWWFIYEWANHPIQNEISFAVRVRPNNEYIAEAENESILITANSLEELHKKIKNKFKIDFTQRCTPRRHE